MRVDLVTRQHQAISVAMGGGPLRTVDETRTDGAGWHCSQAAGMVQYRRLCRGICSWAARIYLLGGSGNGLGWHVLP